MEERVERTEQINRGTKEERREDGEGWKKLIQKLSMLLMS